MFERILVALKFGSAGEVAVVKGAELAKTHSAQLHILHVMDYLHCLRGEADPAFLADRKSIEQKYHSRIKPLLGGLDGVEFIWRPADPALEVCRTAIDIKADLIVLGCHQHPGRKCLGRIDYVGMTILEKAPCAVMMIPFCR